MLKAGNYNWMLGIFAGLLVSCADSGNFAPVAEVSGYEAVPQSGTYRVAPDDTLYSIAWRYGSDYRDLAQYNHIEPPYAIHTGQLIYLREKPQMEAKPETRTLPITITKNIAVKHPATTMQAVRSNQGREPAFVVNEWAWPAHGRILALYSPKNKGIDIGGQGGEGIFAAAPGKVVYAGNGLRGYGNLLIIKHNSQYLSAYAYNKTLAVKEGDMVKKGQKIATMGRGSSGKTMLHFEIRKAGMPVNPLNLLNK